MEQVNQPAGSTSKINLVERAKNIIVQPQKEWDVIAAETPNTGQIMTGYVLILVGAAALAAFIGYAFVGFNVLGYRYKGIDWGIYQALTVFLGGILSVYVTSLVVDMLAPSFNSEKNFNRSFQLVAYSFTPAWIGGLLMIIPAISFIGSLFGLYGLYLMYIGIPKIKKTPTDKHTSYFVVVLVVTILIYIVIGWLLASIMGRIFGLTYGTWGM
jgi:hypothetical protein